MIILIVGSSHIKPLDRFISNRPTLHNFSLENPPEISLFGISGGKITNSRQLDLIQQEIQQFAPGHLILHIGGNDLDITDCAVENAQEISLKLIVFANTVKARFNLKTDTILQLLPREKTRNLESVADYNYLVKETNKLIKAEIEQYPGIKYWKIPGVKNPPNPVFVDGVHFNFQFGMPKYYRNIRGAIIRAKI